MVHTTMTSCPVEIFAGFPAPTTTPQAPSFTGVSVNTSSLTVVNAVDPAQVSPLTDALNTTVPEPAAEKVHTNAVATPPGRSERFAGTGPDTSVARVEGRACAFGRRFITSASPKFVTDSTTWYHCPTDTTGRAKRSAYSVPPTWMLTGPAFTGPLDTGNPEFMSVPVTVIVQMTGPEEAPVYVQLNTLLTPPATVTLIDGTGPMAQFTPPVPENAKLPGSSDTPATPVFVTVSVTTMLRPVHTGPGGTLNAATMSPADCTITVVETAGADLTSRNEFSSTPVTVVVHLTNPTTAPV